LADGPTDVTGNGSAASTTGFKAGTYTLSETGPTVGIADGDWSCNKGLGDDKKTLTIALGDQITCEITNTPEQPKLTLTKVIDGEQYGDTTTVNDFGLTVGGNSVNSGIENGFDAGEYSINE